MPTYEYECRNPECGYEMETFQSMKDNPLTECPKCLQPTLKRKISKGAGIIFKGSGFYETDYKRKSSPSETASGNESTPKGSQEPKKETATAAKSSGEST
jgi:putative FmdB family regulatory protein